MKHYVYSALRYMEELVLEVLVPLFFCVVFTAVLIYLMMFILFGTTPRASVSNKAEVVARCNNMGGIYAEGVCQHPFAPICRRL